MYDQADEHAVVSRGLHTLQHVRKGDSHIFLVSQPPLTDKNGPLLLSDLKKEVSLSKGLVCNFLGAVTGPIMADGMIELPESFGGSLQKAGLGK